MKTFEAGNPIFTRESRARFRGPRAFALLLLYAVLLAAATVLFYGQTFGAVQGAFWRQAPTPDKIGRDLFFHLATAQLFGWMLLAPALAATAISGERERGLLDAVQLSRLAPRRIIGGKLAAILSFIALLLPITLPMIATCFLLGGVAPAELFAAIALQLSTAFFGACLGLFFSARARRAQSSLASSLLMMGAFAFLTLQAFDEWRSGARLFGTIGEWSATLWQFIATCGAWLGPQNAMQTLQSEYSQARAAALPFGWLLDAAPMWFWTCALHLFSGSILLFFATRALRRPLPELTPDDTRWTDFARRALVASQSRAQENRAAALARAAASQETREREESRRVTKLSQSAARAGEVLLRDLPLHHFVNFRDPMLRREVRGKFRWRRGTFFVALGQLVALLVILSFYTLLLFAVFLPRERAQTLDATFRFLLVATMAACAVMGASTLTREREGGTWESLQLSLLRPAEIARAKVLAPLIACFYYALPLWILLPFFVQFSSFAPPESDAFTNGTPPMARPSSEAFWNNGVPLPQVLSMLCVVALAALFCSCVGLLFSSLCRKTIAAIGGTLVALMIFFLLLPRVLAFLLLRFDFFDFYGNGSYNAQRITWLVATYLQPLDTLNAMSISQAPRVLAIHALLMLSLCAVILLAVQRILAHRGDDTR